MDKLICEECGGLLDFYFDERRKAHVVFCCEECFDDCQVDARGLGYVQGIADSDLDYSNER